MQRLGVGGSVYNGENNGEMGGSNSFNTSKTEGDSFARCSVSSHAIYYQA